MSDAENEPGTDDPQTSVALAASVTSTSTSKGNSTSATQQSQCQSDQTSTSSESEEIITSNINGKDDASRPTERYTPEQVRPFPKAPPRLTKGADEKDQQWF